MYNIRKREIIKNTVYISFILLIAVVSTYMIYNKFSETSKIDYNSKNLDVVYHEKTGDKIEITKVTPVTDSVGLSSNSYNLTVKNNLTEEITYKVKIADDIESVANDDCINNLIPKEDIKISVKSNKKKNVIYNLNELEDGIIIEENINALKSKNISIRIWVGNNSKIPLGSDMHYHGKIQVLESDDTLAINK